MRTCGSIAACSIKSAGELIPTFAPEVLLSMLKLSDNDDCWSVDRSSPKSLFATRGVLMLEDEDNTLLGLVISGAGDDEREEQGGDKRWGAMSLRRPWAQAFTFALFLAILAANNSMYVAV